MSAAKTVTVHHPTLLNVSREVDKADVAEWLESGWLEKAPSASPKAAAAAPQSTEAD